MLFDKTLRAEADKILALERKYEASTSETEKLAIEKELEKLIEGVLSIYSIGGMLEVDEYIQIFLQKN